MIFLIRDYSILHLYSSLAFHGLLLEDLWVFGEDFLHVIDMVTFQGWLTSQPPCDVDKSSLKHLTFEHYLGILFDNFCKCKYTKFEQKQLNKKHNNLQRNVTIIFCKQLNCSTTYLCAAIYVSHHIVPKPKNLLHEIVWPCPSDFVA